MNTIEGSKTVLSSVQISELRVLDDVAIGQRHAGLSMAIAAAAAFEFSSLAAIAFCAAVAFHVATRVPFVSIQWYAGASLLIGLTAICVAAGLGHFAHLRKQRRIRFVWSGLGSVTATILLLTSLLFLFKLSEHYSRGTLVLQFIFCSLTVIAVRLTAYRAVQTAASTGLVQGQRLVLIGTRSDCAYYARQLRRSGGGIQISFCTFGSLESSEPSKTVPWPTTPMIIDQCRSMYPDSIILLVDKTLDDTLMNDIANNLRGIPADVYAVPTQRTGFWTMAQPAEIGGIAAFGLSHRPLSSLDRAIKRAFDIAASLIGLIVLSPLLLMASIAIIMDSGRPVFYTQIRHGYNNQRIRIFKFRTMYATEHDEFRQAAPSDPRITRTGQVFRSTSIDELPQLWNILLGEMSIVGPRPHAIPHNELFISQIDSFCRRHTVKPGLTGWAQVNGFRGQTDTLEKMRKRIEYDLYYIDNWSLLFDLKIILLTLFSGKTYTNAR